MNFNGRVLAGHSNGDWVRLASGAGTRLIDLHGGKRSIRTIEFWYETKGNKGDEAEVVAFGQH